MIFCFIFYFITIFLFFIILTNKKEKFSTFPKMYLKRSGINFYSFKRHRIQIDNAKIMQVGTKVYIKQGEKFLILNNVDELKIDSSYLYFKAKGNVELECGYAHMYRYYNIDINSSKIDVDSFKQQCLHKYLENPFGNDEKIFSYVKFLNRIFNIKVENDKIFFGRNKYRIPFVATYKLNGKTKIVNVNSKTFNRVFLKILL